MVTNTNTNTIAAIVEALSKALGTSLEKSRFGWIKLAVLFSVLVIGASMYQFFQKIDPNKVIEQKNTPPLPQCRIVEDTVMCQRPGGNGPELPQTDQ